MNTSPNPHRPRGLRPAASADAPVTDRRDAMKKLVVGSAAGAALWVAPSIASFPGSGAAAASCSTCTPGGPAAAWPFPGTGATAWTQTLTPATWTRTGTGSIGYQTSAPAPYNTLGACFLVERDPTSSADTAQYRRSVSLDQRRTYTFTFDWVWRDHNTHNRPQRMQAQLSADNGSTWTTIFTLDTNVGTGGSRDRIFRGTATPTFTTGADCRTYLFRFHHTFPGTVVSGSSYVYNDIAENAPRVTCA